MANVLANMCNLIMCCLFFAPLIPVSIPICMGGLLWGFIVEKYVLLKRHKVPE